MWTRLWRLLRPRPVWAEGDLSRACEGLERLALEALALALSEVPPPLAGPPTRRPAGRGGGR